MRIMPAFYDWRIKRRIFRRYRELKGVEIGMSATAGDNTQLLARLDEIEQGVVETKVPLTYWDYVYTLRGHIDLVRAHLTNNKAAPVTPPPQSPPEN
jgi:hypothetical protein